MDWMEAVWESAPRFMYTDAALFTIRIPFARPTVLSRTSLSHLHLLGLDGLSADGTELSVGKIVGKCDLSTGVNRLLSGRKRETLFNYSSTQII